MAASTAAAESIAAALFAGISAGAVAVSDMTASDVFGFQAAMARVATVAVAIRPKRIILRMCIL